MSRMTTFILRAHTGTGVSHNQHKENSVDVFRKNAGEWAGGIEISKEETSGSNHSICGYILTYSRLQRENLSALCSQQMDL